jgi:hypothetical protein
MHDLEDQKQNSLNSSSLGALVFVIGEVLLVEGASPEVNSLPLT